jgi:hypothetical protein
VSTFALVRHSAYAVGGDAAFENAVEVCELAPHQDYRVRAAGGAVFKSRDVAEAAAIAANFPDGKTGSPPNAPGYFSSLRIAGAELYLIRNSTHPPLEGIATAARKR